MPGRRSSTRSVSASAGSPLPRVAVVAPTYKRRAALPRFVEALLREPALHELVVAVDGSDDGSLEWLEQRRTSDPRLVPLDLPNQGAGAARQAGVEAATGDVVLLLDDDVIARPGLVNGHARHHAALDPKVVLGYMPNDWTALPPGRRGIAYVYRRAYEMHCAGFVRDPEFVLHGFWGGNFSLPRDDCLRVGVKGLRVHRGQDDREFGIRCAKAGMKGTFDRSLTGDHLYERTLDQYRSDCRIQGQTAVMIHEVHADLVGTELTEEPGTGHVADAVGMGLPPVVRPLWRRLARDPLFGPVATALAELFAIAVREEHFGLEVAAARAVGSLETMRGVLEQA